MYIESADQAFPARCPNSLLLGLKNLDSMLLARRMHANPHALSYRIPEYCLRQYTALLKIYDAISRCYSPHSDPGRRNDHASHGFIVACRYRWVANPVDRRFGTKYVRATVALPKIYGAREGQPVGPMSGTEIIFEVGEDEQDGGYSASALGFGIHTQADTLDELRRNVMEAVDCYFDEGMDRPLLIRLHYVRDDVLDA